MFSPVTFELSKLRISYALPALPDLVHLRVSRVFVCEPCHF